MPLLKNNELHFSFPNIHPNANCRITFHRTLRVPSASDPTLKKIFSLPPSLGKFPIEHTSTYEKNLDDKTNERSGAMIPMYQSEALFIQFSSDQVRIKNTSYPFAIKISAGKRSAVTGKEWSTDLVEKDYVIIPKQSWLDGFVESEGIVKQFIAVPLNSEFTVEKQLSGVSEFGGIQIEVYPMKLDEFNKRFPDIVPATRATRSGILGSSAGGMSMPMSYGGQRPARSLCSASKSSSASQGLGAGGSISQQIFKDDYGLDVWSHEKDRVFVHLFNSLAWTSITGKNPPTTPFDAKTYTSHGGQWYDYYRESSSLGSTAETDKIKTIAELENETGNTILPTNDDFDVDSKNIKNLSPHSDPNKVKDGKW